MAQHKSSSPDEVAARLAQALARRWLRGRVLGEAVFKVFEASILAVLGIITTMAIAGVASLPVFLILFRVGQLQSPFSFASVFLISFFTVLAVSLLSSLKTLRDSDYSTVQTRLSLPVFPNAFGGLTALATDFVCGAARLFTHADDSFSTAFRLLRSNIPQMTPIIVWLWQKKTKATTDEVAARFPEINAVRVLPQLRDIPGIIWLPHPRGVILLTTEFREELSNAFHPLGEGLDNEPQSNAESKPASPNKSTPNGVIVGWYETLGLPPYAPVQHVKKKYRQLAKTYHPDVRDNRAKAQPADKMTTINLAYRNIMNLYEDRWK